MVFESVDCVLFFVEWEFRCYKPSIVAAACVAAGRKSLSIVPIWSPSLERTTMYTERDIGACLRHIQVVFSVRLPGRDFVKL